MTVPDILLRAALPASVAVTLGAVVAGWGGEGHDTLAVAIASAVAGGVLGNVADRWLCGGGEFAADLLDRLRPDGGLPPNHDLARAVRRSQLRAIALIASIVVADEIGGWNEGDRSAWLRRSELERFARVVRAWSRRQIRLTGRRAAFAITPAVQTLTDHIELLCDEAGVVQAPQWRKAATAALAELSAAGIVDRPGSFDAAVLAGAGRLAWSTATHALLWEEIKRETNVFRVLSLRMLHRIDQRPRMASTRPT